MNTETTNSENRPLYVLYLIEAQVTNEDTGLQISGSELRFQGSTLTDLTNNEGSVWSAMLVSAPAGVSPDVTPTASVPSVTLVETNPPLKIQIAANGNPLDTNDVATNANFCVGQNLVFYLTNIPPGVMATNFQWSFQGNYFNNQSNATPQSSTNPYIDPSLLTLGQTTNWWASGGFSPPAVYTASVTYTLMFTNGSDPHSNQTLGLFTMIKPQANIIATTGVLSFDTNYFSPDQNGVPTNVLGLHYGIITRTPGITFSNAYSMPAGVSGTFQWVQVIDSVILRYQTNDASGGWFTLAASNVSDIQVPYPYTAVNRTEDSPGASIGNTINGPFCDNKHLTDSRAFEMYLEFQPTTNGNWVPLRKVLWNYSGEAVLINTNCAITSWVGTNLSNNTNPADVSADTYPRWTNNIGYLIRFTYEP